jgi:hypothetical protein
MCFGRYLFAEEINFLNALDLLMLWHCFPKEITHTRAQTHCWFWEFVNFNDDVLVHARPDFWVHHPWETGEANVPVWLLVQDLIYQLPILEVYLSTSQNLHVATFGSKHTANWGKPGKSRMKSCRTTELDSLFNSSNCISQVQPPLPTNGNSFVACSMPKVLHAPAVMCIELSYNEFTRSTAERRLLIKLSLMFTETPSLV